MIFLHRKLGVHLDFILAHHLTVTFSEIKVHEDQVCHSKIKVIFNANKGTLDMKIISFGDAGTQVAEYDEAGYEAECSP